MLDYRTEQLNAIQQRMALEEAKRVAIARKIEAHDQYIRQQINDQQQTAHTNGQIDAGRMQSFPDYLWRLRQQRSLLTHQLTRQDKLCAPCKKN